MKKDPENEISVFAYFLSNLIRLLAVAERDAKKRKFDSTQFLTARLAPDQYDLTKQVQYAYFSAFEAASHLTGVPYPKFAYDEKSISELKASLKQAIVFLESVNGKKMAGGTKRVTSYLLPKKQMRLAEYLSYFALPNFFFHYATAYDILRHAGVTLGKDDYLALKK